MFKSLIKWHFKGGKKYGTDDGTKDTSVTEVKYFNNVWYLSLEEDLFPFFQVTDVDHQHIIVQKYFQHAYNMH